MAFEKLICPSCAYPLTASSAQTQIACPRCFTWLELESKCNGVCLSCHAVKKTVNTGSCADISSGSCADLSPEVSVTLETKTAKHKDRDKLEKNKKSAEGIKALFKRVFDV